MISERSNPEWMDLKALTQYACVSERTLRDWLHRPIDPTGATAWAAHLAGGDIRIAVAGDVLQSREAAELLVRGLYQEFLRRDADPVGLAAFAVPLQQGAGEAAIVVGIVGSAEYFAR